MHAVHIPGDAFIYTRRNQVVELAACNAAPALCARREFVDVGGLMSYGSDLADASHRPRDMSPESSWARRLPNCAPSTKVELVLNMHVAKALGVMFPLNLLALADEVIE